MTAPTVEQDESENTEPEHTGGMVALIPTAEDAVRLAVAGGDPAGQLHLTLAYLGEDVTGWDPEVVAAVHEVARELTDPSAEQSGQPVPADHDGRGPGQHGPLTLIIFAHSHFNPNGGPDGQEPCMVYQFGDGEDLNRVDALHSDVCWRVKEAIGEVNFPEQHAPYKPHLTAGYNLPPDALSYTGPVTFDRLRVALADEVTDYPLGGGSMDEMTAAVARTKGGSVSSEAREKARKAGHSMPDGSFPIEDGADLANAIQSIGRAKDPEAARRHIIRQAKRLGLEGKIPDSWKANGTVMASVAAGAEPAENDTLVGSTSNQDGDAPPIDWFRDPGLDGPTPLTVGDDGRVTGHLALWHTQHIGFPGQNISPPRSRSDYAYFHTGSRAVLADGQRTVIPTGHITLDTGHAGIEADHRAASAHYDDTGSLAADVCAGEDVHGIWVAGAVAPGLDDLRLHKLRACGLSGDWRRIGAGLELVAALSVPTPGFPVPRARVASGEPLALVAAGALAPAEPPLDVDALADAVAERVIQRQAVTAALTEQRDGLLTELDDSPELVESLLDDLDELAPDEIAFIESADASTPEDIEDVEGLTAAGRRKNWIEQTGTGHLPRYIKRISKHLRRKGMTESHAIATAVNAAKKMCASGDVNFPGKQSVNPGSRAEACKAVAEWEAKKVQARAT